MAVSDYNFTPLKGYEHLEATTQIIVKELLERNIKFEVLDPDNNLIVFMHNNKEYIVLEGTISSANSIISYWISNDKWMTRQFLARKGVRQAEGYLLKSPDDLNPILTKLSKRYVVKPADTDHGIGISVDVSSQQAIKDAVEAAFCHSTRVIIEEFFEGQEYRFLVVGGKLRAIAYRVPANIVGDGKLTVEQLIENKNKNRGDSYKHPLLKIIPDAELLRHLKKQNLELNSVIENNQQVFLRKNSNLSTGGDSIDVTDVMPQYYKQIAEKAAEAADLKIAGIDIIINDIEEKPSPERYIVVELNAPPMLSMHDYPYIGKNRQVEKYVLDVILESK